MIFFSIIIPTSNSPYKLKSLFESIIRNGFDASIFEVILIENGDESFCEELCSTYISTLNIKYYYHKLEGFSAAEARNKGISTATGKFVFFFDDDVILEPNCIKEHLFHHLKNDKPKIVFGFRNNILNDTIINPKLGTVEEDPRLNLKLELTNKNRLWYYAYSCNLSITFSTKKVYFDNNFKTWGNEDQEFAYRLFKNKFEVILGDKCLVHHYTDSKIRSPFLRDRYGLDSDYKDFLLSRLYFVKKHWKDIDLRNFLIDDFKLYKFRNNKWIRTEIPNPNFDFNEFEKVLNINYQYDYRVNSARKSIV